MRNILRIIASFVCLWLIMPDGSGFGADQTPAWLEQRKAGHLHQLEEYGHKEQKAQEALKNAEEAEGLAVELDDRQALSVARQAKDIATRTLARLSVLIGRERRRLEATERIASVSERTSLALVTSRKGTVLRKGKDGWVPMDDAPLKPGDEIRTETGGFVEMVFGDGSRINLGEKSTFSMNPADPDNSSYSLSAGKLKAQIEKMSKRRFAVRTPTACACVRGTDFVLEALADGGTRLSVLEGEVDFVPTGKDVGVLIRRGERAMMTADGVVKEPEKFELKSETVWWEWE